MTDEDDRALMDEVERRLIAKYAAVAPEQVSIAVQNAVAYFEDSRIRDFVPLLVERRVGQELSRDFVY